MPLHEALQATLERCVSREGKSEGVSLEVPDQWSYIKVKGSCALSSEGGERPLSPTALMEADT